MSAVEVSRPIDGVVQVLMNRPDQFNTLNAAFVEELLAALEPLPHDPSVRVVVLAGAGRHFCAGADLSGHGVAPGGDGSGSPQDWAAIQEHVASVVMALHRLPQPVVAAVNGAASGGGMGIALASDVRVCDTTARFNAAFVRIGLSACDMGVSWLLPRLIGASAAFEILLSGRFVAADEARHLGLVSRVVPSEELLREALDVAASIARNSPAGVRATKRGMWAQLETVGFDAGIALENRTQLSLVLTQDHQEAITAFMEKRDPVFKGN